MTLAQCASVGGAAFRGNPARYTGEATPAPGAELLRVMRGEVDVGVASKKLHHPEALVLSAPAIEGVWGRVAPLIRVGALKLSD